VLLEIWASAENVSLRHLPPPPHHHLLKRLRAGSNTRVFSSFDFIVNRCVYFGQNVLKDFFASSCRCGARIGVFKTFLDFTIKRSKKLQFPWKSSN
jgi:hypothetical protein